MQQRQLRLGDILDDYCPRERRVTNHAVVAMVGDEVKQTRCTTCDAEHDFKHAKVPRQRRRRRRRRPVPRPSRVGRIGRALARRVAAMSDLGPRLATSSSRRRCGRGDGEAVTSSRTSRTGRCRSGRRWRGVPVHRPLIRATLPRKKASRHPRDRVRFHDRQPCGGRRTDPCAPSTWGHRSVQPTGRRRGGRTPEACRAEHGRPRYVARTHPHGPHAESVPVRWPRHIHDHLPALRRDHVQFAGSRSGRGCPNKASFPGYRAAQARRADRTHLPDERLEENFRDSRRTRQPLVLLCGLTSATDCRAAGALTRFRRPRLPRARGAFARREELDIPCRTSPEGFRVALD